MAVDVTDQAFINELIRKEKSGRKLHLTRFAIAAVLMLIYLVPFYYLFVTVFKSTEEYLSSGVLELPQSFAPFLDNVADAWRLAGMGRASFNSMSYALIGASLAVGLASAAAFGLTRLRLRSANTWFMMIFAGTLFPFQMFLVPLFFGYQQTGLINSWLGMLLIYTAICIPFPLLVLRGSFGGIAREIDEAARIEGASEWRVYRSMILPNAKGPMIALFLIQFTFIWNDLLFSSILATSPEVRSIMSALQTLQGTYASSGPNVVVTASLISSIPTVLLFIFLRRYFMAGLQLST
ncbi:carbohydrate ABC transporter permease [Pelagovum pacificum]|uniref:Carbohydrate ABC transporter permease n=1 Tax=Pelagovum pacificum TaxID=2588711 RepID=A0A5C5GH16_9RHOB|nr:carbohydrate ABC transporter permease [Pelagovum pacificum]QQA43634.1 carbohydrate ABC transporter permease [Pelagovum pacificum]TNY33231.1 carbohydrate ABC transporter permease [Pelagovum pacificum]